MAKVVKTMSFNDTLEDEKEMLDHLKKFSFAPYIKRLIYNDMKGIKPVVESAGFQSQEETKIETDLFSDLV